LPKRAFKKTFGHFTEWKYLSGHRVAQL
jgi:hypothetical protein